VVQQWTASAPWNITRLPDGTLLTVANGGQVQRLENNGTATTLFSGLDAPFGIASAGDGTVWISEQGASAPGRVTRRTLTGAVVDTISYGWDNPEGLHVDDAGDLWIAETSLGQILRYDGVTLQLVGQNLGLPVVITRRGPGALLASSANLPAQLLGIDILP
jgi:streptogramin lyase